MVTVERNDSVLTGTNLQQNPDEGLSAGGVTGLKTDTNIKVWSQGKKKEVSRVSAGRAGLTRVRTLVIELLLVSF